MSGNLLLRGGGESEDSECEGRSGDESVSDPPSVIQSPTPGRRSPGGILSKLKWKLEVGGASQHEEGEYKLYPWRWFMLATLCLLNLSNGMVGPMHCHTDS